MPLIEYAFDINLVAVVRIKAQREDDARKKLSEMVEMELMYSWNDDAVITEASINPDVFPFLFEINGGSVE